MTFDSKLWGFDREAKFNERQAELIRAAAAAPDIRRKQARLTCALLSGARHGWSKPRPCSRVALATNAEMTTSPAACSGGGQCAAQPAGGKRSRTCPIGDRQPAGCADMARDGLCPPGQMAGSARRLQNVDAAWARCRSNCSVGRCRRPCARPSRCAISATPSAWSTSSRRWACRRAGADAGGARSAQAVRGASAAPRTRSPVNRVAAGSNDRRAARQGRLREIVLTYGSATCRARRHPGARRHSPRCGAATETGGSRASSCWRICTPRMAAIATPSMSCARRCWRIPIPISPQDPGRGGDDLRQPVPCGQGGRFAAIAGARPVRDYRELTPIGRRGDEMIRRLADRLVGVDLHDKGRSSAAASSRITVCRAPRARRWHRASPYLSDEPQAGPALRRVARDALGRSCPMRCASSACC